MSAAFSNTDQALHRQHPDRTVPECFEEFATHSQPRIRIDRVDEQDKLSGMHPHGLLQGALCKTHLDKGLQPEDALEEALMDEASDFEVHPDELTSSVPFVDDPQQLGEAARKALHQSPYKELHRLNIRISDDRIAILGQTTSFFLKQMAQEVIRQVVPGIAVDNLIGVRHQPCHSPIGHH